MTKSNQLINQFVHIISIVFSLHPYLSREEPEEHVAVCRLVDSEKS
jgi:hypothetical protein